MSIQPLLLGVCILFEFQFCGTQVKSFQSPNILGNCPFKAFHLFLSEDMGLFFVKDALHWLQWFHWIHSGGTLYIASNLVPPPPQESRMFMFAQQNVSLKQNKK